ncbi:MULTISPECIES: hypothetical protein [unclassified Microcoleus]|uniref:hypothetical protein n=1 Tax=unclassified Microcoleus TaxID=2642155 RepID=UPI002FCE9350
MRIEATPWHETRTLIPPRIEMLQEDGMIQYKSSFLKKESPRCATLKLRFIHYNVNYVKYCFLKEFYPILFDGVRGDSVAMKDGSELTTIVSEVIADFVEYCREQPSEESDRELFRDFCKAHLFG